MAKVRIDGAHSCGTLGPRLPLAPTAWENGEQLAKLALDGEVILTPPCIFHS